MLLFVFFGNLSGQTWNDLFLKADSLFVNKQYDEALIYAKKAADYAKDKEGTKSKPYANSMNLLGNIYYSKGEYYKAIFYFSAEKDAKKAAYGIDSPNYARALNNLSAVLVRLGQNRDAEPIMREALKLKISTVGENDTSVAYSANNLGVVCFNLGKYNEAEKYYLLALKIRKKYRNINPVNYAQTLYNLGSLYKILGNFTNAVKYLSEAVDTFKKVSGENDKKTLKAKSELGMTYLAAGQPAKAKKLLDEYKDNIKRVKGNEHPDYYSSLYSIAMYYWSNEQFSKAEDLLSEILKNVEERIGNGHPLYASCLNSLGLIAWQTGKLNEAEIYLSKSEKIRRLVYGEHHFEYATALHNLAAVQKALGKYEISDKNYKKAFNLYVEQIKNVFPGLSELEKAKFYNKILERFNLYNLYVLDRMKEKPELIADMYYFRQLTKGRLLDATRKIRKEILESNNPELISRYKTWAHLKEKVSKLYLKTERARKRSKDNIDSLKAEINDLEKYLSENSFAFLNSEKKKSYDWLDVQKHLDDNEVAVEIIRVNIFDNKWLDSAYYAVLIIKKETKNHPDLVLLKNGHSLENYYINNYLNSIQFQIDDPYSYKAFWEKIEQKIKGKTTVYMSQDGIYNKINPAAMRRPDGSFIVDSYNIVLVSKTSDIANRTKGTTDLNTASVFGNPKYTLNKSDITSSTTLENKYPVLSPEEIQMANQQIPQLPGSETEINNLVKLLKQHNWRVSVYLGNEADEYNFKHISSAGVLHVATHGYFLPSPETNKNKMFFGIDVEKPLQDAMMRSGLLFAGASNSLFSDAFKTFESENGVLTAYEASSLLFDNVNLLVLSACETGLGDIKNGEGVYGLQRAFQIAGTDNLIMSLWKVSDYATQILMNHFYSYLLNGNNISQSLRKAQLDVKAQFEHPYFWGGFIYVQNN